jgi:hypothetical protein
MSADTDDSKRHIVFIQYGYYAEAVHRFTAGGMENYYARSTQLTMSPASLPVAARLLSSHSAATIPSSHWPAVLLRKGFYSGISRLLTPDPS